MLHGRIRVTAATEQGALLKQSPLLINKIVPERLSDKLQIMMMPAGGTFFFAEDVVHR